MKHSTKITSLVFALAMTLVLVACGGNANTSAGSAASSASASASAVASSSASSATTGELVGKPWVTSVLQGNLPPESPEVKNDMYTHYNYEYLTAHQNNPASKIEEGASEVKAANLAVIKDSSKSSHDLDQLRIFYNQAADSAGLQKTGLADVQPFLDRIDAVTSIDEMNALLSASDFPFSPFAMATLTTSDTRNVNVVAVGANLALVDPIAVGGAYYQDSDDPQKQQNMTAAIQNSATLPLVDLLSSGMDRSAVTEAFNKMLEFEKAHGKYVDYTGKYISQDFGAAAEEMRKSFFTLDELCSLCPNFPMKATLDKLGKGASPQYIVTRDWIAAFNDLWTNENIETIKLIAKTKVLSETRPYRDPTAMNDTLAQFGQPAADAESFAYSACDHLNSFAILLGQTYVNETLGPNAKSRLSELSQQLVNTYKDLIGNTPWIGEESKQRVIEKLDHVTLNILEPKGGYYDFSGVELTPTDQGGTLIGNYLKLKQYRLDQESKLVGQPANASSAWYMIRPTVSNAFYDPNSNSINILPGYMTSLVYTDSMSNQELLAGIGFTIGHEISHGFDYMGAQLDAYGAPNPVFSDADVDAFVLKATTLAMYYKGIEIKPGVMVNGENVITEAAADLCGMQAVLELAGKSEGIDYEKLFADFAHTWAQVVPDAALPSILLDNHELNNLRVNVNAQMFDAIYEKLGVSESDAMYLAPEKRINIWGPKA